VCNGILIFRFVQYDDGIHTSYMGDAPPSMYDPHVAHRPLQNIAHHSPHMNHGMHQYHTGNHVAAVSNHVMGPVTDVHKRDKDAIYG
jgi:homeobox protein homothorax